MVVLYSNNKLYFIYGQYIFAFIYVILFELILEYTMEGIDVWEGF